jgi:hypothetical protein
MARLAPPAVHNCRVLKRVVCRAFEPSWARSPRDSIEGMDGIAAWLGDEPRLRFHGLEAKRNDDALSSKLKCTRELGLPSTMANAI